MTDLPLAWSFTPRAPYLPTVALMDTLAARVADGDASAERLIFCEHEPVITLGRGADRAHVLDARGVPVVQASRGGDVTAHGPGQLVLYPVLRLPRGLVDFIERIAGEICAELAARGVRAAFRRQPAGVWVEDRKIAALGLRVRRHVATHGFALNVGAESHALFDGIVPCGIADARVTSIAREGGALSPLDELAHALAQRIARSFSRSAHKIDSAM